MDSQEQVLVAGGSDHVCCSQESPVEDGGVTEKVCTGYLQGYNSEDEPSCERFGTTKLRNLKRVTRG